MPLPKNNLLFGFGPKLTAEQTIYVNSIFDNQLTICNAPAGTGKTTLAVACAKIIGKDLVYIFSPVEEDKMGFRPGTQEEKELAYINPLLDALEEIDESPLHAISNEFTGKRGTCWVYPKSHIFVRGTNLKDKIVIIDECQNFTIGELKKILTRIHDSSKVIMIGHTGQIDLKDSFKSGFIEYIEHYRTEEYAQICELTYNFRGNLARHADLI